MILSFKPQFIEPIMRGQKIHTIREDLGNRWKVGRKIEFATGVRTKQYMQFKAGLCIGIQQIVIWKNVEQHDILNGFTDKVYDRSVDEINPCVYIDGRRLTAKEELTLSFQDGFNSVEDFYNWFIPLIDEKLATKMGFHAWVGNIIHWTDYRY